MPRKRPFNQAAGGWRPAYRRMYPDTLILPYQTHLQTHLGAENALFLPKKRARLPKNLSKYPYFAVPNAPPNAPRSRKTLILPYQTHLQTHLGAEKPLFCRTKRTSKRTSEPKMPYFYLKTGPAYRRIYRNTLILPYQTHLGAENALFLPKNRARTRGALF